MQDLYKNSILHVRVERSAYIGTHCIPAEISTKIEESERNCVSNDVMLCADGCVYWLARRMCGKVVLYHLRTNTATQQQKRVYLIHPPLAS